MPNPIAGTVGGRTRLPALERPIAQRAAGLAAALPGLPARVTGRPEHGHAAPGVLRRACGRQPVPEPAARRARMHAQPGRAQYRPVWLQMHAWDEQRDGRAAYVCTITRGMCACI